MKTLGKCPYCDNGEIEIRNLNIQNQKVKLYACSNAHWEIDVGDTAVLTEDSTCSFRIFSNQYLRYNKRSIGEKEIRTLLRDGEVEVRFYSSKSKSEYFKFLILDQEYGTSVIWD